MTLLVTNASALSALHALSASACKAKIKVAEDLTVISHQNEHSHSADPVRREVLTVRANLKRKAVESQETPQQIRPRFLDSG